MLDLIKPNIEWKKLAREFGGTFIAGSLLSASQMRIQRNSLIYHIKTSYSNDNLWSASTIIYCTFHYQQECSIEIHKSLWTNILCKKLGVLKVSKGYKKLEQELQSNAKLSEFRKKTPIFALEFNTEGDIAEDYEVLPKIELKIHKFLSEKEEFNFVFDVIEELACELIKRNIISLAP